MLTTDGDGKVTIPFPRFIDKARETPPQALTCRVEHPDYAETVYNDVAVVDAELPNESVITLHPGAQGLDRSIYCRPTARGRNLSTRCGAALRIGRMVRLSAAQPMTSGGRELPRLPAGTELLPGVRTRRRTGNVQWRPADADGRRRTVQSATRNEEGLPGRRAPRRFSTAPVQMAGWSPKSSLAPMVIVAIRSIGGPRSRFARTVPLRSTLCRAATCK